MGAILLIPFLLIRFVLLSQLDRTALKRAAHFPPMEKRRKLAYWLYQLFNAAIFICLFFLQIRFTPPLPFYAGIVVYLAANILLIASMVSFAAPTEQGVKQRGVYALSRNPMYIAYFAYFTGCALLTQSTVLFALVILFQITAHWLILAEEHWCAEAFGDAYLQYMKRVRRYI